MESIYKKKIQMQKQNEMDGYTIHDKSQIDTDDLPILNFEKLAGF